MRSDKLVAKHIQKYARALPLLLEPAKLARQMRFGKLRDRFYRSLWEDAAIKTGATFRDWGFGLYRIERDGAVTVVRHSSIMVDDHLRLELMGNKALTYEILREKGYVVPHHSLFSAGNHAPAEHFMAHNPGPFVVKPASGTGGGRAVTTNVVSRRDFKKAARRAACFDRHLLIEEQLEGSSFRLLYLDGEFIDAIRRDPPILTGDGRHSIRGLVQRENIRRLKEPIVALSPLEIDCDASNYLASVGLRAGSILEAGESIAIKQAVNENAAAQNHCIKELVHPRTIALGRRVVSDLGVRFAGLDVICKDIGAPLTTDNGCINEINTTPGIHHHYLISNPAAGTPVAELVLRHLFENETGLVRLSPRAERKRIPKPMVACAMRADAEEVRPAC